MAEIELAAGTPSRWFVADGKPPLTQTISSRRSLDLGRGLRDPFLDALISFSAQRALLVIEHDDLRGICTNPKYNYWVEEWIN